MEPSLLTILIGGLSALLMVLVVALVLNCRRRKRCNMALERLFEDVKEGQSIRNDRIIACLMRNYKLQRPVAEELAATLFAAETLFLSQFMELQMREQTVDGFYQNLCGLLDRYLDGVPRSPVNHAPVELSPPTKRETI